MPVPRSDPSFDLVCHPDSFCSAVNRITVHVPAATPGGIKLLYRLDGRVADLLIPASAQPGPADGLWAHTCFEAFVGVAGDPAYREFNFSPSGQWAAYAFADYRARVDFAPPAAPDLTVVRTGHGVALEARLPPALLPMPAGGGRLEIGLSAVVEAAGGGLSYWALAHGAGRPDFHRRDGFVLELAAAPRS